MENEALNINNQTNTDNQIGANNQADAMNQPPAIQNDSQSNSPNPKSKKRIWIVLASISAIVAIVALVVAIVLLNNQDSNPGLVLEQNHGTDPEVLYYIIDSMDDEDPGFLGSDEDKSTKYEIFENYSDYKNCFDTVEVWANDLLKKRLQEIEENTKETIASGHVRDPESYKNNIIKEYTDGLAGRVTQIKNGLRRGNFDENFFENNYLVLVEHMIYNRVLHEHDLKIVGMKNNVLNVAMNVSSGGLVGGAEDLLYFVSVPKTSGQTLDTVNVNVNSKNTSNPGTIYKPIIYLYPTEATNVSVKLLRENLITTSYPQYSDGWDVFAKPDGSLVDNESGRSLYSLYYENENFIDFRIENNGFVVAGEETARFLEEKLAILGLNEREAEEFIIYWLPKLEKNRYNYIRFATAEEINENMPLSITPEPNSVIRVLMTFAALDEPMDVAPQNLSTPERTGFTVVEWGGTEIRKDT